MFFALSKLTGIMEPMAAKPMFMQAVATPAVP
jgi:hypothetical protein